ncbi:MAG: DUF177 domain-containing protein [Anaeroplasmataceae bacterium]|nr:DUF177 domain-containing protein [Anaeroplasmataceae bacterium]
MRLSLAQLRKLNMPYSCSEDLDISSDLDGFEDIIHASKAHITYVIKNRGYDTYLVNFSITVDLVMECSITLQEVYYQVQTNAEELFTTDESIEDANLIELETLDTKEAILTNILIAKPMKVVADGVHFESDDAPIESDNEEEGINPAFAKLKDFL